MKTITLTLILAITAMFVLSGCVTSEGIKIPKTGNTVKPIRGDSICAAGGAEIDFHYKLSWPADRYMFGVVWTGALGEDGQPKYGAEIFQDKIDAKVAECKKFDEELKEYNRLCAIVKPKCKPELNCGPYKDTLSVTGDDKTHCVPDCRWIKEKNFAGQEEEYYVCDIESKKAKGGCFCEYVQGWATGDDDNDLPPVPVDSPPSTGN